MSHILFCQNAERAGDHIFRQGAHDSNIYLVKSGLLKAYYIRADGKGHIKSFLPEGPIIGSMVGLIDGDPCAFSLMAVDAVTVIAIPYSKLEAAALDDLILANA